MFWAFYVVNVNDDEINIIVVDDQKTVDHHKLTFFNPNQEYNATFQGNHYDKDSLIDFIDGEMGITRGRMQVIGKFGVNRNTQRFY